MVPMFAFAVLVLRGRLHLNSIDNMTWLYSHPTGSWSQLYSTPPLDSAQLLQAIWSFGKIVKFYDDSFHDFTKY